jgi:hypothetical protein
MSDMETMEPFEVFVEDQKAWSLRTFGIGERTLGTTKHIRKELKEAEADPHDLYEWTDIIILGIEGFWRHGGRPRELLRYLTAKMKLNKSREYPFPKSEDKPSEHIR